jgi:hypothetical protein
MTQALYAHMNNKRKMKKKKKKCSTSLVIKEMQNETALRFHLTR